MEIPPCTTGKHSTVDDTPVVPEKPKDKAVPAPQPVPARPALSTATVAPPSKPSTPVPEEPESDDPSLEIPANATCRRRGCNTSYDPSISREEEKCVHHPGQPIFHEGAKGWSCCKKRVLEFDEFLKLPGCSEKQKHLFVGKRKPAGEEKVQSVR